METLILSLLEAILKPLLCQLYSMDVKHGSHIHTLESFQAEIFWVSQSITPTSAPLLVSTGLLLKLGSCVRS